MCSLEDHLMWLHFLQIHRNLLLIFYTFVKKNAKWAHLADYLRTLSTDLDQLFIFDRHVGEDN